MPESENNSHEVENLIAAIIIILIGVCGLYGNGYAFVKFYSSQKGASFQKFCISHSVSNIGVLCFMICFTAPMIYTQNTDISHSLLGKIIGQIAVLLWDVGVYSHLFVSFNRLLVIRFPFSGALLLSDKVTSCMVLTVWIMGTIHALPYFYCEINPSYDSQCFLWFTPKHFTWEFGSTPCGEIVATWGDLYTGEN
uniref:G_PROTEIN_RECEP_F1_2 domain-containing protein n=1 Tax=Heterorhabditis bacteriophora TaxID=37862 RepID=A0A1I7WN37_HETBA